MKQKMTEFDVFVKGTKKERESFRDALLKLAKRMKVEVVVLDKDVPDGPKAKVH